jgi:hypothetical protein
MSHNTKWNVNKLRRFSGKIFRRRDGDFCTSPDEVTFARTIATQADCVREARQRSLLAIWLTTCERPATRSLVVSFMKSRSLTRAACGRKDAVHPQIFSYLPILHRNHKLPSFNRDSDNV